VSEVNIEVPVPGVKPVGPCSILNEVALLPRYKRNNRACRGSIKRKMLYFAAIISAIITAGTSHQQDKYKQPGKGFDFSFHSLVFLS